MHEILDLERYPIDAADSAERSRLAEQCRSELTEHGSFNLEGFLRPAALEHMVAEIDPIMQRASFRHARRHNIYFKDDIADLAPEHPARIEVETVNRTLCADQIRGTVLERLYEWPELLSFLAAAMGRPRLYVMDDPLARLNVMAYEAGQALNWHFDRSQFTTTLLLRSAQSGGEFQYRSALRSPADPNYEGVARLLQGKDPEVRVQRLAAGTLTVFAGRNTAHRVTPVGGPRSRMVAVFSYYESPGVAFGAAERIGFYGRA